MSFSFDNPLYIGDKDAAVKSDIAELQSEVGDLSQLETADKSSLVNALNEAIDSTLNGVNRDLTNLSTVGTQKLRSLNAYANEGELLTDADGLAFVENYAHSTFDASKFTKVGSPTITSDGIVFDLVYNTNYVLTQYSVPFSTANSWSIELKNAKIASLSSAQRLFSPNDKNTFLQINTDGRIIVYVSNATTGDIANNVYTNYTVTVGETINAKLYFTGTAYEVWINGQKTWSVASTTKLSYDRLILPYCGGGAFAPFLGVCDLKQFSITVDGVEVFSGNKTGVDTYVSNLYISGDYTIKGSPTISASGVVSGFSLDNYIQTPSFSFGESVEFSVTPTSAITTTQRFCGYSATNVPQIGADENGKIVVGVLGATNYTTDVSMPINQKTYFKINYVNSSLIEFYYKLSSNASYIQIPYSETYTVDVTNFFIGRGFSSAFTVGTIDLNDLKITKLIPFTYSKTGSKIVNSIYRDSVNDMAEQLGYANYYTLQDETKGNYTVVGSPTISSDFVASGFDNGYVQPLLPITVGDTIEFSATLKQAITGSSNVYICGNNIVGGCPAVSIDYATGKLRFNILGGSTAVLADYVMPLNQKVYFKIYIESITSKLFYYKTDYNAEWSQAYAPATYAMSPTKQEMFFGRGYNATYFPGEIDLKDLKITRSGRVYEAVTEPNFTLPQVELYGLIARQSFAPSNKYKDLTLGASGSTYTAPADGWFTLNKAAASAGQYINLVNSTTQLSTNHFSQSADYLRVFIPVKKNDVITNIYTTTGATNYFRFIYSVGSESEAN